MFEKQGAVDSVEVKEQWFFDGKGKYVAQQENFAKIPGAPVAYWVSEAFVKNFSLGKPLSEFAEPRAGLATGDNDKFERWWFEVSFNNIGFGFDSTESAKLSEYRWFPCNSGGDFRKWSFNNEIVVDWLNDGEKLKKLRNKNGKLAARPQNTTFYFKEGLTWNKLSASKFAVKYKEKGFIFDDTSRSLFIENKDELAYLLGLMCSCVTFYYFNVFNPSMSFTNGDIKRLPYILDSQFKQNITLFVQQNISLSKSDWDSFETSWDFAEHPLLVTSGQCIVNSESSVNAKLTTNNFSLTTNNSPLSTIAQAYQRWKAVCNERFAQLKANEEELNRIFIDIYGLQDELTPEVEEKDVTVHRVFDSKDDVPEAMKGSNYILTQQQVVKSLISYAVGCMFGRYSLDKPGLVYAGGEWDAGNYQIFAADKDAIIPISDNEYFNDDIVARFVEFIKTAFGADEKTLEANLNFIATALGGNGSARDVIRAYFNNGFYADHCKTYQKRPIYWLFDSGKKNGFKCLIYMHRYQKDTIARIRTDYLHEQQSRYRTAISDLQNRIDNAASTGVRVKLQKQLATVQAQVEEARLYEEKIHHLADQMLEIDLDDGVKHNYAIFKDVLAKIK